MPNCGSEQLSEILRHVLRVSCRRCNRMKTTIAGGVRYALTTGPGHFAR